MEYARQEVRFAAGGWSSGSLVTGIVADGARGFAVRPEDRVVTHTLLKPSRRRVLAPENEVVGDAQTPLPEPVVRLVSGMAVRQSGARVGTLRAVWCDRASGRIMHALVRPAGGLLGRFGRRNERVVAAEQIAEFAPNGLLLAEIPAFADLPPYRSDVAITNVARASLSGRLVSPTARRGVNLRVEDGTIHLSGTVESEEQVARAVQAVQHLVGARGLVVDLVAAESLGARVEQQLSATLAAQDDGRPEDTTGGIPQLLDGVRVLAEHGIVYLDGRVPTKELNAALERAARSVPGVRVVMNQLAVSVDPQIRPPKAGDRSTTELGSVGDAETSDAPDTPPAPGEFTEAAEAVVRARTSWSG